MGAYAPTVGIVGTTLGLINALSNLSEPEKLGHLIASAFVATLWGLLSANLMASAVEVGRMSELEITEMEMVIAGIVNIQSGANPRLVAQKLRSLLPPGWRRPKRRRRPDVGGSRARREGPPAQEASSARGAREPRALAGSYADMMTLLMVLFLVLFAMSQVDITKFTKLKSGLAAGFGAESVALEGKGTQVQSAEDPAQFAPGKVGVPVDPGAPELGDEELQRAVAQADRARQSQMAQHAEAEVEWLEGQKKLEAELAAKGMTDSVRFTIDERGLVVTIVTNQVVFPVTARPCSRAAGRCSTRSGR